MDYEKKYKEALERAKQFSEKPYLEDSKGIVEYIFPELKIDDESIRKALIKRFEEKRQYDHIEGILIKDILAWLEKQGEKKSAMIQWKGDNLKEVVDFTGVYKEGFEKWFHNSWEEYEKYVHEHGDIFKIFNEDGSHIEVPIGAWIIKAPDGYITASRFGVSPILTELSIESNFKFKKAIEAIENYVNSFPHSQRPEIYQHINFLKSFRDRVQPQSNQEWSEEDENLLKLSLENLTELKDRFGNEYGKVGDCIVWLKSLKERYTWNPSDEQIKVCKKVYADVLSAKDFDLGFINNELNRLEEELKKLKE